MYLHIRIFFDRKKCADNRTWWDRDTSPHEHQPSLEHGAAPMEKKESQTGLEPATSRSEVWCAIHCATGPTYLRVAELAYLFAIGSVAAWSIYGESHVSILILRMMGSFLHALVWFELLLVQLHGTCTLYMLMTHVFDRALQDFLPVGSRMYVADKRSTWSADNFFVVHELQANNFYCKHPWPSWLRRQTQVLVLFEGGSSNLPGCIPFRFLLLTNRPAPSHTTFFDQFYIAKNGPLWNNTLTSVGEENEILPQNGRELFRHLIFFCFSIKSSNFLRVILLFLVGTNTCLLAENPPSCLLFVCCLFVVVCLLFLFVVCSNKIVCQPTWCEDANMNHILISNSPNIRELHPLAREKVVPYCTKPTEKKAILQQNIKSTSLAGLEPATPRSEVWCAVHCATGTLRM